MKMLKYKKPHLIPFTFVSFFKNLFLSLIITIIFGFCFGYKILNVVSNSMSPHILAGSVIVTKQVDFNDINVGDVITYSYNNKTLITHRVVEKYNNYVLAKGDANTSTEIVRSDEIKGVVVLNIKNLGNFINWLQTNLIVIVLMALMIIVTLQF